MKISFIFFLLVLLQQSLYAQPTVPGTTTFGNSSTTFASGSLTPSGDTHGFTAAVLTNSVGNSRISLTGVSPISSSVSDMALIFGDTLFNHKIIEVSIKSNDGSEFKLNTLHFGMEYNSNQTVTMTGYKNNLAVAGAVSTINVVMVGVEFSTLVDVSANPNFGDIDEVRFLSNNIARNTWFLDDIVLAIAIPVTPCSFTVVPPSGTTIYWKGCTNTNWNTASNWSTGVVPVASDVIYIPTEALNPLIIDEVITCSKMIVEIGAKCSVDYNAGGKLLIEF